MIDDRELNLGLHRLAWVQPTETGEIYVECSCGWRVVRSRHADAAIAHERHQTRFTKTRKAP